jgi:hypothetical protein
LSESSFTCLGLQASGLLWRLLLWWPFWIIHYQHKNIHFAKNHIRNIPSQFAFNWCCIFRNCFFSLHIKMLKLVRDHPKIINLQYGPYLKKRWLLKLIFLNKYFFCFWIFPRSIAILYVIQVSDRVYNVTFPALVLYFYPYLPLPWPTRYFPLVSVFAFQSAYLKVDTSVHNIYQQEMDLQLGTKKDIEHLVKIIFK